MWTRSVAGEDRLSRRQLIGLDVAASIAFTMWFLLLGSTAAQGVPTWQVTVLALVAGLPLAVRRLWPRAVLAVVLAAAVVEQLVGDGRLMGLFVAAAFALYIVATSVPKPAWEPTLAVGIASAAGFFVGPAPAAPTAGRLVQGLTAMGAAWVVGRLVRQNRLGREQLARRAAEQAVLAERVRIARELHDVVAHSMSVIAVKAGVASHVAKTHPEEVENALAVIESTSRDTLVEMRRMLGVLRVDDYASPDSLARLVEGVEAAGVRVDLRLEIDLDKIAEPVRLTIHRLVQEALTNVIKHAAPARCEVSVRRDGSDVRVAVTDDGGERKRRAGDDRAPGHGLIGMRERVAAHGGEFRAGPRPEGGFEVAATLPDGTGS